MKYDVSDTSNGTEMERSRAKRRNTVQFLSFVTSSLSVLARLAILLIHNIKFL